MVRRRSAKPLFTGSNPVAASRLALCQRSMGSTAGHYANLVRRSFSVGGLAHWIDDGTGSPPTFVNCKLRRVLDAADDFFVEKNHAVVGKIRLPPQDWRSFSVGGPTKFCSLKRKSYARLRFLSENFGEA